jgi:hypothetical protein
MSIPESDDSGTRMERLFLIGRALFFIWAIGLMELDSIIRAPMGTFRCVAWTILLIEAGDFFAVWPEPDQRVRLSKHRFRGLI